MGFDGAVHTSSSPIYQNYSGWDIYRSWASLMGLIAPDVMTDIVKSMILDGQQGGLLPKWSHQSVEDFVMPGDPGPIIVASAYAFGVRNFDTAAALALMKKSATGGSTQGVVLRGNEGVYESAHFIPGNPSETLEYASSDFAIANFAKALGDTRRRRHLQRALAVLARPVQRRVGVHPPAQRRRNVHLATQPGHREPVRGGQRGPVHVDGAAQPRRADHAHGWTEHRGAAAGPPLHRAQRRPGPARTSTSATSPSTTCRGRTTSPASRPVPARQSGA
jgi:hypothetical protein